MVAAEFGVTAPRLLAWMDELQASGAIVDETPAPVEGFQRRTEHFRVARPAGWVDDEPPAPKPEAAEEETPVPVEPLDEFDMQEHEHPRKRGRTVEMVPHYHAWGSTPHVHLFRAVCTRDECAGVDTHNIHPSPEDDD